MLGSALVPAPRSSTQGRTPPALSPTKDIPLTTQEAAHSTSLSTRLLASALGMSPKVLGPNFHIHILGSNILVSTGLVSAAAHATPRSYSRAASAALVPAAVDPPNSPDGPGPSPGLSPAFSSGSVGSVAAHAPPSIHGPSQTLSTLGRSISHAPHRRLLFEKRHPTPHY
jgi:hypothetical protein